MKRRLTHTIYRSLFFPVLCIAFSAGMIACGDDADPSPVDGDEDAEADMVEDIDEEPAAMVRLSIMGNIVPVFNPADKSCTVEIPLSTESGNLRDNGIFDVDVYNLGDIHYAFNFWLKSEDVSGQALEGDITLSVLEVEYDAPPTWNTAAIPGETIPLEGSFALGGETIVPVEIFTDHVASYINSIMDQPSIDEEQLAGFQVSLTLVAFAPNGSEIRTSVQYPLQMCRGCIVDRDNPASICCYTNIDPEEIKRVQNYRTLLSALPDQNERCHLFQDRDMALYCSWLEDCYYTELDCPSFTCQ